MGPFRWRVLKVARMWGRRASAKPQALPHTAPVSTLRPAFHRGSQPREGGLARLCQGRVSPENKGRSSLRAGETGPCRAGTPHGPRMPPDAEMIPCDKWVSELGPGRPSRGRRTGRTLCPG